ncbi:hypothetical protein EalM132_00170 [Exiguobacterium phage vB_EalM-132]|nr:hypothetical protein EalM132_00170 [Exiguobacterium phage vB_EalM-132]
MIESLFNSWGMLVLFFATAVVFGYLGAVLQDVSTSSPIGLFRSIVIFFITPYVTYRVPTFEEIGIDFKPSPHMIVLQDDRYMVPLSIDVKDNLTISKLRKLNPGKEIYIKAKIDTRSMSVHSIKGYSVKG